MVEAVWQRGVRDIASSNICTIESFSIGTTDYDNGYPH